MVASRKNNASGPTTPALEPPVLFEPLFSTLSGIADREVAIGVSGGADSAMLLVCASLIAPILGKTIHAVHIHHGLQAAANDWARHTAELACDLGVACHILSVLVPGDTGKGTEAAARQARYLAYQRWATQFACPHFLLAHHRDDQAETVLLRLLRGAGVQGMAGMVEQARRGQLHLHRPWLTVPRAAILAAARDYEVRTGWAAVQDPSNTDPKYTRSAVRALLSPILDARWPQWQGNLLRHAQIMQESSLLLADLGNIDLAACDLAADGSRFSLRAWRLLPAHRQANALRQWLAVNRIAMPTQARLTQWVRQLREVHALGHDRNIMLKHQACHIRCRQGWVILQPDPGADQSQSRCLD